MQPTTRNHAQPNRSRKTWSQVVLGIAALGILGFIVATHGDFLMSEIGLKNMVSSHTPENVHTDIRNGKEVFDEKTYCGIVGLSITTSANKQRTCTGFLIAPSYIMTAGHCCYDKEKDDHEIPPSAIKVYQATDMSGWGPDAYEEVKKVIRHKNYVPAGTYKKYILSKEKLTVTQNDYCILEAEKDLLTDFCKDKKTFELASVAPGNNDVVRILGYGDTKDDGDSNGQSSLYWADIKVYKCNDKIDQNLKEKFKDPNNIGDGYVCAFTEEADAKNNKGACQGDSGGPLFKPQAVNNKYQVYAITAWGFSDHCDPRVGFFAETYSNDIHTWVREVTAPRCQAKLMW